MTIEKQMNRETVYEIIEKNRKINEMDNEIKAMQIKLETLVQCYTNLASTYHVIAALTDKKHSGSWKECESMDCNCNYAILVKLSLV